MIDWSKFAMPKKSVYTVQTQDIAITFRDGKILITYYADAHFAQMLEQMSHYMRLIDLNALLEEGESN